MCKTFQITDNEKYGKIRNSNNFVKLEIIEREKEKQKKNAKKNRLIQKSGEFQRQKKIRDKNDEIWLNPIWQIVLFCIKFIVSYMK